jgi:predicted MFS family arabinose efflux permease
MAPERRGAAVASFASCFYLGQSVGVAVAGGLVERSGTAAIMLMGAGGVLLLSQHFGWRRSQRPRVPAV